MAKLKSAGVSTQVIEASSLTHAEVNKRIGATADTLMTPPVMTFLKACFGG